MKTKEPLTRVVEALANVHWHGREIGPVMKALIKEAVKGGADVLGAMPNTAEPLITADNTIHYYAKAEMFVPVGAKMTFIPIVMLTENTTYEELCRCAELGIKDGKIYPYLRTTKSAHGVRRYGKMLQVVLWCGMLDIKVHVHFEHPNPVYINRDAEYLCLPVCEMFLQETEAVIIWEHGSDARCIPAWKEFARRKGFYVTLTAHHLASNEDIAFGDVRRTCKPPIKTEFDRTQFIQFVSEGHPWTMAGADDAGHDKNAKHVHEEKCACGAFTSPFLLPLYAHALDELLHTELGTQTFIDFTSRNARKLHGLPETSRPITLVRKPFRIPASYRIGSWTVEPYGAGEFIGWSIV